MNKAAGYVESQKSSQPKNNQDCSDYRKHGVISLPLRLVTWKAGVCAVANTFVFTCHSNFQASDYFGPGVYRNRARASSWVESVFHGQKQWLFGMGFWRTHDSKASLAQ
jgi:hypothetical protein